MRIANPRRFAKSPRFFLRRALRFAGCAIIALALSLGVSAARASSGGFFQQQVQDGKASAVNAKSAQGAASVVASGVPAADECEDGLAQDWYPCKNMSLVSVVGLSAMEGFPCSWDKDCFNDVWGWTDPVTGVEYALLGRVDGTAFVDLSVPAEPVFLGMLPKTRGSLTNTWRDIKVVNDHAVIVADAVGDHGMQVFDLTQLREVTAPPVTFEATALYDGVESAHNVVVNEEKEHAYIVGMQGFQKSPPGFSCGLGAHILDMSDPAKPEFAGCYNPSVGRGYTHDSQCVRYRGPDAKYVGKDLCFSLDEEGGAITDVTDPASPREISVFRYPNTQYAHQGWLTEDHRYLFANDELDEASGSPWTRTLVFDVRELEDPVRMGHWYGPTEAIDHNLYVHEGRLYESNYAAGLRIMDISYEDSLSIDDIEEVAYFDTSPSTDKPFFLGHWSNYPFFESGIVLASDMASGLFVLAPSWSEYATSAESEELPAEIALSANYPNPFNPETTIRYALPQSDRVRLAIYDMLGHEVAVLVDGVQSAGRHEARFDGADLPSGSYVYRLQVGEEIASRTMTLVK